jgi:MORN repeat
MQFSVSLYANGLYQGLFHDSSKEDIGIFLWNTGKIYIGEWKNNKIQGIGLFVFNSFEFLHSYFDNGTANKIGILRLKNNDVCLGEWENGKLGKNSKFFSSEKNKTFSLEGEKIIKIEDGFPAKANICK